MMMIIFYSILFRNFGTIMNFVNIIVSYLALIRLFLFETNFLPDQKIWDLMIFFILQQQQNMLTQNRFEELNYN